MLIVSACPVHCKIFNSIPVLYHQIVVTSPPLVVATKNISRHCKMICGEKTVVKSPWLTIIAIETFHPYCPKTHGNLTHTDEIKVVSQSYFPSRANPSNTFKSLDLCFAWFIIPDQTFYSLLQLSTVLSRDVVYILCLNLYFLLFQQHASR